jgi:hypothetical protein
MNKCHNSRTDPFTVVGPLAAASPGEPVAGFAVVAPESGVFIEGEETGSAGVTEYLNVGNVMPASYVPLP